MDKETLSNYGWIVICVLVMAVMLALATPFGSYIAGAIQSTTQGLFDVNQNALDSAGIEIMEQEFEEMLNGPSATDSPVKFGQPYQMTMEENGMSFTVEYVFYPDGSATMWMADTIGAYLPAGTVAYTKTEVILEGDPIKISEDGTYLYDPEDETLRLTVKSVSKGNVQTNTAYTADPYGLVGLTGLTVQVGTNGSITVYQNGVAGETIPASAITWYENYFVFNDGGEETTGAIYPDGSKIAIGEIVCVYANYADTCPIKYGEPYGIEDDGMIISYAFYENGSYGIYINGSLALSAPAGTATYASKTVKFTGDPLLGDAIASISSDGTKIIVNSEVTLVLGVGCFHKTIENGICKECGADLRIEYKLTASDYKTKTGIDISSGDVVIPEAFQATDGKWYKVIAIGYHAFENCTSLTSITIPEGVTIIGDSAFRKCTSLTSITIPEGVTIIDQSAFAYCTSLTNIDLPSTLTSIKSCAFSSCNVLESIVIPDSVTTIGGAAFEHCWKLKTVILPSKLTTIDWSAFTSCNSLTSIEIPDSVTTIGSGAFYNCTSLTSINVDANNANYCSVDGILYSKDMVMLHTYPGGKPGTTYIVPEGVKTIYSNAFSHASLENITLPSTLTTIGYSAFYYCNHLTNITIPKSVTSIGDSAFAWCYNLTSINVDDNNANYCSVDGVLYTKDMTTLMRYPADKTGTSYIVPESVTTISDYAFNFCDSLESITIPEGVTTIGYSAILNCSNLKICTFMGTVEQWNAISKGSNFGSSCKITEIICSDGTVSLS